MDVSVPTQPRRPSWPSEDSDGEESECDDEQRSGLVRFRSGSPQPDPPGIDTVDPSLVPGYVRLQEEHIEASVVVLKNGIVADEGTPDAPMTSPRAPGGKLTFNLTPEQLGTRSGTSRRTSRSGGASSALPVDFEKSLERPLGVLGNPRKSSLRRSSVYSNQSELDKQLQYSEQLEPQYTQSLPGCTALLYDEQRTIEPSLQARNMIMVMTTVASPDANGGNEVKGSNGLMHSKTNSPTLDHGGVQRKEPMQANKFDEISTVYDHFPTDFLPEKYLCGLCRKLLREPRVLECLHTFCRACLGRVASEATRGQDSALFWHRLHKSADFDWDPALFCSFSVPGTEKCAEDSSRVSLNNHVNDTAAASPLSPFLVNGGGESRFDQLRSTFQSFREQHCLRSPVRSSEKVRIRQNKNPAGTDTPDKVKARVMYDDKEKVLICPTCKQPSELPAGPCGVSQLPQHFLLARKIENIIFQHGTSSVSTSANGSPTCTPTLAVGSTLCELCSNEVTATVSCQTCSLQLCNFCKEAHKRQRSTASHGIVRLGVGEQLRRSCRRSARPRSVGEDDERGESIKCPMHPEQQLKLFCTTCHQVICGECSTLLHRDHRCTTVARAGRVYGRFVRSAIEQTRPLEDYALQQVAKLNDLTVRINSRCEAVQREVDAFVDEYVAALEEHRKALTGQIGDIRQAKTDMIMAQKLDLEHRSQNARAAIEFAEELMAEGSDVENLIFVSMLLKRFEQCLKPSRSVDRTVTDMLQFLPDEEVPSARVQTGVPLYGIVTTQSADPRQCTLEHSVGELVALKAHKRVQLTLIVRDHEGRRLAHGGMTVQTDLRFRDNEDHSVAVSVVDNRDGSYALSFVPPRAGVMHLMLSVDGQIIEECPIALRIHKLRPHYGVFHCCTFCSSSGSKASTCACGSIMPGGYQGCGHGHDGHPGQRHWSCCGSLQQHSDCTASRMGRKQLE
ncbi:tripartite motif protein 45 [Anopheles sinensis]|uniref:Tripartite motif protein 45 n=1 Tax=Anopheles sinensis TaxID=74873 RepID=A0A084WU92_ANOSI|nr:tripartite motif protein 45 [Anopheles sinensis]